MDYRRFKGAYCLRPSLFCDVTQRRLVVTYRCFGTACRFHLQGPSSQRNIFGLLVPQRRQLSKYAT